MICNGIAVFDFDWSLIEQDSDFWTIHSLSPQLWQEVLEKRTEMQWTDLMDWALCKLQENGCTKNDIARVLEGIPFTKEMRQLLLELKQRQIPVIILSDANTFYIETILKAYGVRDCITEIITNTSYTDEQGRLRIRRHIPADGPQHNCPNLCAANLCKGQEMDRLIPRYSSNHTEGVFKIVYTGDGKNDFCPSTRLHPSTDILFMRKGKGLDKYLQQSPEEKGRINCTIVEWWRSTTVLDIMPKYYDGIWEQQSNFVRNSMPVSDKEEDSSVAITSATACQA